MPQPAVHDSDRDLVLACRGDDPAARELAFRRLHDRYRVPVDRVCQRITRNTQDAHDAAQETFAALHRKLDGIWCEGSIAGWLQRVAVNASLDINRGARVRPRPFTSLAPAPDRADETPTFEDPAQEAPSAQPALRELQADVRRAIAGLSEKLRTVVALRYFDGLAYEEIAVRLGVSLGTVKSRMFRAHEALAHWLEPALHRHCA